MAADAEDTPQIPPVVGAADAFMNRLRPPAEEDVPLLTDVVGEDAESPPPPTPVREASSPVPLSVPLSADDQARLAEALETWLDLHLTDAVLKTLDGVVDQLVARLGQEARQDLLPRLLAALQERPGND